MVDVHINVVMDIAEAFQTWSSGFRLFSIWTLITNISCS
jgi:hypothetical protein